jgi:2-polyprenyl-3-methyl-5-hydroxy-6-metoxy-1,4-benzoquinol methylase
MAAESPFARSDVVARYESWYSTPYGILADRIEQAMLLELLQPFAPGASVLEIGCGTGHFAAALATAGFRGAGIDREAAFLVAVLEFVSDPVAFARPGCTYPSMTRSSMRRAEWRGNGSLS